MHDKRLKFFSNYILYIYIYFFDNYILYLHLKIIKFYTRSFITPDILSSRIKIIINMNFTPKKTNNLDQLSSFKKKN